MRKSCFVFVFRFFVRFQVLAAWCCAKKIMLCRVMLCKEWVVESIHTVATCLFWILIWISHIPFYGELFRCYCRALPGQYSPAHGLQDGWSQHRWATSRGTCFTMFGRSTRDSLVLASGGFSLMYRFMFPGLPKRKMMTSQENEMDCRNYKSSSSHWICCSRNNWCYWLLY